MNCHDFDAAWNEILDAETPDRYAVAAGAKGPTTGLTDLELAARGHAEVCKRCGMAQEQYRTLRRALRAGYSAMSPVAGPSPALIERVVAGAGHPPRRSWASAALHPLTIAVAASVLALLLLPIWRELTTKPAARVPAGSIDAASSPQPGSQLLSEAMAEATEATWDLALTTSGPTARLSREMLEVSALAQDQDNANASGSANTLRSPLTLLPSVLRLVTPLRPGSEVLHEVGDGLSAGVRPLSSSAWHAFGFLRAPSFERTRNSIHQPASKGA
jgi:hypothetical protein